MTNSRNHDNKNVIVAARNYTWKIAYAAINSE